VRIYLDSNATTRPNWNMLGAVREEVYNYFGNPSSLHSAGQIAKDIQVSGRESLAKALNARPSEIIFTSGGTEANNLALKSYDSRLKFVSSVEHSSVANCNTRYRIPVREDGLLDLAALEDKLERTKQKVLVSVMFANNETGVILDPENKLLELKEKYEFIFHIDAVQAFGKVDVDVEKLGADLLTISGHKFHALKGIGALYINRKLNELPSPLQFGGTHERGFRPGTENQAGIASISYMAEKISDDKFYQARIGGIGRLRGKLEEELSDIAMVNGSVTSRVSNTSNLYFPGLGYEHEDELDIFLEVLSEKGVCVSGKSACASGMPIPSKVLSAMFGKGSPQLYSSVRVSLSVDTTEEEIIKASELIRESYNSCKKKRG